MARTFKTSLPLLALSGLISCASPEEEQTTDVSKIVYAVRQHTVLDDAGRPTTIDVAGGMGQVMDYGRYEPGGRLEVLDLRTNKATNIIAGYPTADISSVDVSFDATKVLFTMKTSGDDSYHIYWASLEPEDGQYQIHQLTFGNYDDINAVWAPGDNPRTTSLKPPSMSKAAASACWSIQRTANRLLSGTSSPGRML